MNDRRAGLGVPTLVVVAATAMTSIAGGTVATRVAVPDRATESVRSHDAARTLPVADDLVTPTREDLARAYLRFERAWAAAGPRELGSTLDDAFDDATLGFFAGRGNDVVAGLDRLVADLRFRSSESGGELEQEVWLALAAWRVRMASRAIIVEAPGAADDAEAHELRLTFERVTAARMPDGIERVEVVLREADLEERVVASFDPREVRSPVQAVVDDAARGARGAVDVVLRVPTLPRVPGVVVGRFHRVPASLEALVVARETTLASLVTAGVADDGDVAVRVVRARLARVRDLDSDRDAAAFLVDPNERLAAIDRELEVIARGRDPERGRTGSWWTVVPVGGFDLPCRVVVPESVALRDEAPALVIALHGAGGDESMFVEGYGGGRLAELAEERPFILVCPNTTLFASSDAFLRAVIDRFEETHAIDRERVHLIGHSLGAGAIARVLPAAARAIRSAVLLCGGLAMRGPTDDWPPLLVIAAERDPLVAANGLRSLVGEWRERGADVTFRFEPDAGHTLVVGRVLDEVVDWSFGRPPREAVEDRSETD